MKDWINQVYAQACIETQANVTYDTMNLTASTHTYTLPSTVSRILEMFVTYNGVQYRPVQLTTLDDILQKRVAAGGQSVVMGTITHYALLGLSQFEVYPTPGSADQITIYFVQLPTALSADADVPILPEPYASKVLEYGALAEAADFKSDPQEGEYRAYFNDWMGRLRSHLARKQGDQVQQMQVQGLHQFPPHDPSTFPTFYE